MDLMANNNRALAEHFTPRVVGQEYMEIFLRVTGRHDRLPHAGQPALQYADTAR